MITNKQKYSNGANDGHSLRTNYSFNLILINRLATNTSTVRHESKKHW